jgi:hypothetical protein
MKARGNGFAEGFGFPSMVTDTSAATDRGDQAHVNLPPASRV